jgi:hypothetical protein
MATITFTYTPDYDENEKAVTAGLLLASLEYRVEIPKNMDVTLDDLQIHFEYWLRGLGYHPDEL